MSQKLPREVLNFDPPDLWLDGGDVSEMIREMPARPIVLKELQPNPTETIYRAKRERLHPGRVAPALDEKIVMLLFRAVEHLRDIFSQKGREWPLDKYIVLASIHPDHDLADISFCPKVETLVQGIPFEVPVHGVYANGPAVRFFLSLSTLSLVKTMYMR